MSDKKPIDPTLWPERAALRQQEDFARQYQQDWPAPNALDVLVHKLECANRAFSQARLTNDRMAYRVTPREFDELVGCLQRQKSRYKGGEVRGSEKYGTLIILGWTIEPTYPGSTDEDYYRNIDLRRDIARDRRNMGPDLPPATKDKSK